MKLESLISNKNDRVSFDGNFNVENSKSVLSEKQSRFVKNNMLGKEHTYIGIVSTNPDFGSILTRGRHSILRTKV